MKEAMTLGQLQEALEKLGAPTLWFEPVSSTPCWTAKLRVNGGADGKKVTLACTGLDMEAAVTGVFAQAQRRIETT